MAAKLGFDRPTRNSMDATSDRDFALEFVQACAILAYKSEGISPEDKVTYLMAVDNAKWRTVLNYGLPAVVYMLIAHAIAGRVNRA